MRHLRARCGCGVLTGTTVAGLGCRIIVPVANDVLESASVADTLAGRGITYVPDFVANAGGVIQIDALERGLDEAATMAEVRRTEGRVRDILAEARSRAITPLDAAYDRVGRVLATAESVSAVAA